MIILYAIGIIYLTWIFYLAVMSLRRARKEGKLPIAAAIMGYPVLGVGLVLDAIANVIVGLLFLAELPRWDLKEWKLTYRLERHLAGKDGKRKTVSRIICAQLLDRFDLGGKHCKK